MLQIPAQPANPFVTYIGQQGIPVGQHRFYLKWMQYYHDLHPYCEKYDEERSKEPT